MTKQHHGKPTPQRLRVVALLAVLGPAIALGACGGDGGGEQAGTTLPELSAEAEAGLRVAQSKGCLGCHSVDGSPRSGPTFAGLAGSERRLSDGSTVTADEDYLRRSILEPDAQRVEGFATRMPKLRVDDEEVGRLIALIEELR